MRAAALIAVVTVAAGCEKKFNEEYCLKHGDDPAYAAYCHGDGSVPPDTIIPDGPPGTYRITGVVNGLFGNLVLQNNGGDDKTVMSSDGKGVLFFFDTTLPTGAGYDVTVSSKPDPLMCDVSHPTGTVGMTDVSDIVVTCTGDPGIRCGTGYCAVGDSCCLATGVCNSVTVCASQKISCDDTADCVAGVCCGELNGGSQVRDAICETLTACESGNHEILCDPTLPAGDPACTASQMCLASSRFVGYHSCQ